MREVGDKHITSQGYILIFNPDHPTAHKKGYCFEHRMIAWDAGILTDLSLNVHHRNGVKDDNRAENLQAVTLSEHAKIHREEERKLHGHDGPVFIDGVRCTRDYNKKRNERLKKDAAYMKKTRERKKLISRRACFLHKIRESKAFLEENGFDVNLKEGLTEVPEHKYEILKTYMEKDEYKTLKPLRKSLNVTITLASAYCGISTQCLSQYENGSKRIPTKIYERLNRFYNEYNEADEII